MNPGEPLQNHAEAEGIELTGDEQWNSGKDIPYDDLQDLEDFLSQALQEKSEGPETSLIGPTDYDDESSIFSLPDIDIPFKDMTIPFREYDTDLVSREEAMEMMDVVYDSFEDIFEIEIPESARENLKENTAYDESIWATAKKSLAREDFLDGAVYSAIAGAAAGVGNFWRANEVQEKVYEETEDIIQSTEAMEQAMSLTDEVTFAVAGVGLAYTFWSNYDDIRSKCTGKYMSSSKLLRKYWRTQEDFRIAISPDEDEPQSVLYTGVSENFHRVQDTLDSPTYHDPLLLEGMDVFARYLVAEKLAEEGNLDGIDHDAIESGYGRMIDAYGILKNNGGFMVDKDTFIDVSLDPEESLRAAENLEKLMSEADRTTEQIFGYAVGGGYLIMEYERGNIDPAEVMMEGRDAMPEEFQELYDMAFMENI